MMNIHEWYRRRKKDRIASLEDGNYTLEEIADKHMTLDAPDPGIEEDRTGPQATCSGENDSQTHSDAQDHPPTNEEYIFPCGFGGHEIPEEATPVKVKNARGYAFVCPGKCFGLVPKELFVKQFNVNVKGLVERGKKGSPLEVLVAIRKKNDALEAIAHVGGVARGVARVFSPATGRAKSFVDGFTGASFTWFAFCSSLRRSDEDPDYALWYAGGRILGHLTASVYAVGSVLTVLDRREPLVLLAGTNIASALYEAFRPETKQKKFAPEDAYKKFYQHLFAGGYEVARCKPEKKNPCELVVRVRSRDYTEKLAFVSKEARALALEYGLQADWTGPKTYDKKSVLLYVQFCHKKK